MRRIIKYVSVLFALILTFGVLLHSFQTDRPINRWLAVGKMQTARTGACSVSLSNGRVLITGGEGSYGILNSAEVFDASGEFTTVASMSSGRADHVCVVLDGERVLVAGGRVSGGGATNAAEIYDPATDTWSAAGAMTAARAGATATLLKTGGVLIAGGENDGTGLASLEVFDAINNVFQLIPGSLSSPRKNHVAAIFSDGRVLIAGGSNGAAALDSADIFDPKTGSVSSAGKLLIPRAGLSATTLLDGKVLLAGGTGETGDVAVAELYDPQKQTFTATASMLTARHGHQAFRVPDNNNVLIVGGTSSGKPLSAAELYIPWQGVFKAIGALSSPRAGATGSVLPKAKVLIAGGTVANMALASGEAVTAGPTVTVNQGRTDFTPGMIVFVGGAGWQPNETVKLTFIETDGPDAPVTYQAIADAFGNISNSQFAPDEHDVNVNFLLTADGVSSGLHAEAAFADASADIDQCGNGKGGGQPCVNNATYSNWVNGNLGASKSQYFEGDFIPYRMVMTGLTAGAHTLVIQWDSTKSGHHAIDYIGTWDNSAVHGIPPSDSNLCSDLLGGCPAGPLTTLIPVDPNLAANNFGNFGLGCTPTPCTPIAGAFTLYGATFASTPLTCPSGLGSCSGPYALSAPYSGDSSTAIAINFNVPGPSSTAVLGWSGHIATRKDWGIANSAISIPGSPFHTRLKSLDGTGGNQDRSLSADAVVFPGSITIIKTATPTTTTPAVTFPFTASPAPLASFSLDASNSGTSNKQVFTGITVFPSGGYTINETPVPSGWDFTSVTCDQTSANGGSYSASGASVNIKMNEGEDWTCTYTNTKQTTLTLVKTVTNDNGGTAAATAWTLSASGPAPISGATGSVAVTNATVTPGTYTLSESATPTGYTASDWSCVKNGGAPAPGSSITLATGDSATCTVNNNDNGAHLKLVKTVTNDNGGTAAATAWTLTASGPTPVSGVTGTADVDKDVSAGSYTLGETGGPAGYTASLYSCVKTPAGGSPGAPLSNNSLTLALGESAICTINNNDNSSHLKLVKTVTNDNGGSAAATAWTLTASGPTPLSGVTGSADVDKDVSAGSYTLDETGGPTGYTASLYSCVKTAASGSPSAPVSSNSVALALGDSAVCTINNNDNAVHLKLVKTVTNDNGGSAAATAWTLTASGPTPLSGVTGTADVDKDVSAGSYSLGETGGPAGYTAGLYSCVKTATGGSPGAPVSSNSVTLALGDSAVCTINNNDNTAHLKLVKTVTNDNGGSAAATAWTLTASGPTPLSGVTGSANLDKDVNAGSYALDESGGPAGYTASLYSCVKTPAGGSQGTPVSSNSLTLAPGDSAICTINNNDNTAHLKLVKTVTNDNGGTAAATAWTLTASGPTPLSGVTGSANVDKDVNAGSYTLDETGGPANYTASLYSCVKTAAGGSPGAPVSSNSLALAAGDSAVCTINNNDNGASLKLVKTVSNNNGGTAVASQWTLSASGPTPISGAGGVGPTTVTAGTYTLSESVGPSGYTPGAWGCTNGVTVTSNQITLSLGQSTVCTINNSDNPASLKLVKTVSNDNGGTAVASQWTLSASGPTPISGAGGLGPVNVKAGTYGLSESGSVPGYTNGTSYSCVKTPPGGNPGNAVSTSSLSLGPGDSAVCTINNHDNPSYIIINKFAKGGNSTFDFTITGGLVPLTPSITTQNGTGTTGPIQVPVGNYNVSEQMPASGTIWMLTDITCTTGTPVTDNGVVVSWDVIVPFGTTVTCAFTNTNSLTTRTQGFWATHTALSNDVWNGIGWPTLPAGVTPVIGSADAYLCNPPSLANPAGIPITATATPLGTNQLLGGFWSGISKTSTGKSRSAIDQDRMQLLQQYLAAVLNFHAFGSVPVDTSLSQARAAYCTGTDADIKAQLGLLAAFNSSGDSGVFTPGASATSQLSKSQANIPFWDKPIR